MIDKVNKRKKSKRKHKRKRSQHQKWTVILKILILEWAATKKLNTNLSSKENQMKKMKFLKTSSIFKMMIAAVMSIASGTIKTMIRKVLNLPIKTKIPMEPLLQTHLELKRLKKILANLKLFLQNRLNNLILRIGELEMLQQLVRVIPQWVKKETKWSTMLKKQHVKMFLSLTFAE